jgi:hypothetical protein
MLKSFKKWLRSGQTRTIVNPKSSNRKNRARPDLQKLEDRITPTFQYLGGPVLANADLQPIYMGADWGDSTAYIINDLNAYIKNITAVPPSFPTYTDVSAYRPADMAAGLERFTQEIANSSFMDMLTADGYGVGRGTASPGFWDPVPFTLNEADLGPFLGEGPNGATPFPGIAANPPPYPNPPEYQNFDVPGIDGITIDASKPASATDTFIQQEIEGDILSGAVAAPTFIPGSSTDTNQIYLVYLQPGVTVGGGGVLGYHSAFIDPQIFGSAIIHYAVVPFSDYDSDMSTDFQGMVNPIDFFAPDSGHGSLAATAFSPNGPYDLGADQLATTPVKPPPFYYGHNGVAFDNMTVTAAHEIAETMTDPDGAITNLLDGGVSQVPGWQNLTTNGSVTWIGGVNSGDLGPTGVVQVGGGSSEIGDFVPEADTLVSFSPTAPVTFQDPTTFNIVTVPGGEQFAIQKITDQFNRFMGPNDMSPNPSGVVDSIGDNLLFNKRGDGHIIARVQTLADFNAANGVWGAQIDVTAISGAPLAVSDVSAVSYGGSINVLYRGPGNQLIDLFNGGYGWQWEQLEIISGFGIQNSFLTQGVPSSFYFNFNSANDVSAPTAVVYGGVMDVFVINGYGHIEDVYGSPWLGWFWADVSVAPGYSTPASGAQSNIYQPDIADNFVTKVSVATNGTFLDVVYKDVFDNIQDIEYNPFSGRWVWNNMNWVIFGSAGGFQAFSPNPLVDGDPSAVFFGDTLYIAYAGEVGGNVQTGVLGRNAGVQIFTHDLDTSQWLRRGLSGLAAGAPSPALANRPDVSPHIYIAGSFLHVIYNTANAPIVDPIDKFDTIGFSGGTIIDAVFNGTRWFRTSIFTGPDAPVWGAPTAFTRGNTIMLFWSDPFTVNGAPYWDGGSDGEMGDFGMSELQLTYTQPNFFPITFLFAFDI